MVCLQYDCPLIKGTGRAGIGRKTVLQVKEVPEDEGPSLR
jgi:hypothetical protein